MLFSVMFDWLRLRRRERVGLGLELRDLDGGEIRVSLRMQFWGWRISVAIFVVILRIKNV